MLRKIIAAAGVLCAIAALVVGRGGERVSLQWLVVCAVGVAVAAWVVLRHRVAGFVVGVLAAGGAGYLLVVDLASGVPGGATALLAVGALVVVLAAPVRGGSAVTAALAVGAVACVAVGAVVWVPSSVVESSTAGPVEPAPVAERPAALSWRWEGGGEVVAVAAAGPGVAVAVEGGEITGLDGVTGTPRWRYARQGASVYGMVATPDRRLVVAAFSGWNAPLELFVVLDAVTGEPVSEWFGKFYDSTLSAVTDVVLSDYFDDKQAVGIDLRTGERRWTWTAPPDCVLFPALPAATGSLVMVAGECPGRAFAVALDASTGTPRWQRDAPSPPPDFREIASFRAGRDTVLVTMPSQEDRLLDAATGTPIVELGERFPKLDAGTRPLLTTKTTAEVFDLATRTTTPVPPDDCLTVLTTDTTYARLCNDELLWQEYDGPQRRVRLPWGGPTGVWGPLGGHDPAVLVSAPGAVVAARDGDRTVLGLRHLVEGGRGG